MNLIHFPHYVPTLRAPVVAVLSALIFLVVCGPERAFAGDIPDRSEQELCLARLGVDQWHKAGVRGSGVKVAVLDSGFRGYKDFFGKSLPKNVTTRSFRKDGNLEARDSQHGILCGEVIHTIAPAAELLFANWEPDDADAFLAAVKWAKEQGASIISCSVIAPSLSDGEGGGLVHEALSRLLGEQMLFFASAGNTAERHWSGLFQGNTDNFHQWAKNVVDNPLTPWGEDRVAVELCCKAGSRYELLVYEHDGTKEVTLSKEAPKEGGCVAVRFEPKAGHSYRVRVRLTGGKAIPFHLTALHAGLKEVTSGGSVVFPADGPEVIAVGAVNQENQRTSYSAIGLKSSTTKPDIMAPVPFPSSWRAKPFSGTSAAAPQAAAFGALLWSKNGQWKAPKVRSELMLSALDLGVKGPDCETGHGLIRLPR